jgi:hypothetical protein
MKKLITSLAMAVCIVAVSAAVAPSSLEAQCVYGCACEEGACGCNSRGNGDRCDAGGTGCVVSACDPKPVAFAADGSVIRLASTAEAPSAPADAGGAQGGGATRWEYVSDGLSVARDCRGIIVARYYDPQLAAAIRAKDRTITL